MGTVCTMEVYPELFWKRMDGNASSRMIFWKKIKGKCDFPLMFAFSDLGLNPVCFPFPFWALAQDPAAAAAKSLQSCPTLCNPMDCSLPGSSVHGIFQARVSHNILFLRKPTLKRRSEIHFTEVSIIGSQF